MTGPNKVKELLDDFRLKLRGADNARMIELIDDYLRESPIAFYTETLGSMDPDRRRRWIHRLRWKKVRDLRAQNIKVGVEIGWNDKTIYRTASQMLKGLPQYGGPDAVEKSYKRVQRAYKAGDEKTFGPLDTGN